MQSWQKSCEPHIIQGTIVGVICDYVMYFVELYETECKMDALGTLFLNLLDYSG